jgi:hypothetical protein
MALSVIAFYNTAPRSRIINDMPLGNFSKFLLSMGWVSSPAYDLLNVKMIQPRNLYPVQNI